jgi:zinc/manganese transport system substrate-binding protein
VRKLEVPTQLDRAQGDVHAAGNPHIQTDPRNIAQVAAALATRLAQVDPAHASQYAQRQADFAQRWQQAMTRWTAQAAPLRGVPVVSQHKAYVYLYDWLGLKEVAVLEPKPGVEPTASHLQGVLATLKATPARMVLYSAYQDPRPSEWLSKNAGIPAVKIPFTVGGTEGAKDLFGLFDDTVARLVAAGATR